MASFTATDWAVTVSSTRIENKERITICQLTATVGSTNDDAGFLPLPSAGALGLVRNVSHINIIDGRLTTTGTRVVDYDKTNHKLKVYTTTISSGSALQDLASATACTGTIFIEARGW